MTDRPSAHSRNKYGDSESPCLRPLDGEMKPRGSPLIRTEYDVVVTVYIANSTHLVSKPSLSIICRKKPYSTLSYALLMSSLTAIWPVLPFLLFLILYKNSYATEVLSVMSRLGTKALWASDITWGSTCFNLLARTFDTTLEITFAKLIGLKSDTYFGSLFFGINTVWL